MKITVLTAFSEEYRLLQEITGPTKQAYADKYGYEFLACKHVDSKRIAWERVEMWREALNGCDWLFFTGCDAAITNPQVNLVDLIDGRFDFIFACDGCGLQSDSFLLKNTNEAFKMFHEVLEGEFDFPNEQDALQSYLIQKGRLSNEMIMLAMSRVSGGKPCTPEMEPIYKGMFNSSPVRTAILPQRSINAYPQQHYGGTGSEPYSWQLGDFVCHLPGKSLEFRINAFKEILAV